VYAVVKTPEISAGNDTSVCKNEYITLKASGGISYYWNTSETSQMININPDSTTIYIVTGFDKYGCSGTDSVTVSLMTTPDADFSTTIDSFTVTFTNTSTYSDSFFWSFGDGNISIIESPVHTYKQSGIYYVSLSATNDNGCSDTIEKTVGINTSVNFENHPDNFEIYPNPFTDKVYIKSNSSVEIKLDIIILNVKGETIFINSFIPTNDLSYLIDLGKHAPGVYVIKIVGKQVIMNKRIIKMD